MPVLPTRPLVSILIPSYNQGAYIRDTLESCLAQEYRPIEIIVVDGASKDDTVKVLESYAGRPEIRWTSEPDRGVVDAVNKGFARVRGDIVGIQSSDDCYLPGAIRAAVEAFQRHPGVCLVYGDSVKVDASGRELERYTSGPFSIENFLSKRTVVLQPSAFFLRQSFSDAGGWNPDFFNADTECWLRMILREPALKVDAFWSQRRMHGEQRDRHSAKILDSYRRMMFEHPGLKDAPEAWRRAARCGWIRHRLRYQTDLSDAQRARLMWEARQLWPAVRPDFPVRFIAGTLLRPLRRCLSRLAGRGNRPS